METQRGAHKAVESSGCAFPKCQKQHQMTIIRMDSPNILGIDLEFEISRISSHALSTHCNTATLPSGTDTQESRR